MTSSRDLAEASTPACAAARSVVLRLGHGDARHAEQEARIDAVVAGLDAFAAEHAAFAPIFARPSGPSPVRRMSMTPSMTSFGSALTPAGPVTGQTSTHLPQRVQASTIACVRAAMAVSNVVSLIDATVL